MKTTIAPKKVRTNSNSVRAAVRAHILEAVTDGNGDPFHTFEKAAEHLKGEFERVADYPNNLRKFPNNQNRFHDYLMGIPFAFEYTNYGISEFLNGLGINPEGKEYDPMKSAQLYASLIYREIS